MLITEETKAASYQKMKHIQPVLLRYSYNPDARRFPLPGVHAVNIRSVPGNPRKYYVLWSDHYYTLESEENLEANEDYHGMDASIFAIVNSPEFAGKVYDLVGNSKLTWLISNYKQDPFKWCATHCVHNLVGYTAEQYEHFINQPGLYPLKNVITDSIRMLAGKFRFEKRPALKKKCFCSNNTFGCDCIKEWLLEQENGKFVIQSVGHCYSWDSDIGYILDSGILPPTKIDSKIFDTFSIGKIERLYVVINIQKK